MPYKDKEKAKACKARWWKEYRIKNPFYHRDQMRAWRASRPEKVETPEEELRRLIEEQAKDDRLYRIGYGIRLTSKEDEVYNEGMPD